jgi:hypothetical protein
MCVPLPHEQGTNSADTAYEIVCLRILEFRNTGRVCVSEPHRLAETRRAVRGSTRPGAEMRCFASSAPYSRFPIPALPRTSEGPILAPKHRESKECRSIPMNIYPILITFISAEIIFLLVRSSDVVIMCKSTKQRTKPEQLRIERGLIRSILVEGLLFVPSSAILLILLSPLLMPLRLTSAGTPAFAINALLGVISYGFPFAAVRRIVTVIALNTLREFAAIIPRESPPVEHNRPSGEQP